MSPSQKPFISDNKNDLPNNESIVVGGISFTHQDLLSVIDDFYTRIQNDPVLKIPFQSVSDWPEHIRRLTHFWWIRFGGKPYMFSEYNPVTKHFFAGFNADLLKRWLSIFHQTLEDHLTKEQAHIWKMISERMGEALSLKNDFFKSEYEQQIKTSSNASKKDEDTP